LNASAGLATFLSPKRSCLYRLPEAFANQVVGAARFHVSGLFRYGPTMAGFTSWR
jgi:hypothetical protein